VRAFHLPAALVAVVALAAALLLFRLGEPDWTPPRPQRDLPRRYVWDECLYAFTAHRLLERDPNVWRADAKPVEMRYFDPTDVGPNVGYAVHHPPLALFTMTASADAFGWTPFAVRLPGALCGAALVACTWLLARRVRGEAVATLAAVLVASDGVWFTISRVAIPHVYVAAATAAALVAGLAAWEDDARRARWTLVAGAFGGLALAFKSSAAILVALVAAALLVRAWTTTKDGGRGRALGAWAVAFLALPPLIYLASWTPFFALYGHSWRDFLDVHRRMREWHASMPAAMGPSTPWWTWPVVWRPVRLYMEGLPDGTLRGIDCRGNPLLWWSAVAAAPWAAVRFARRRRIGDLWIAAAWLAPWAAFAFVPRFGFSYYMLPAAPCAAAAVATAIDDACGERTGVRRAACWTFALAAVGVFVAAYPSLAAVPHSR